MAKKQPARARTKQKRKPAKLPKPAKAPQKTGGGGDGKTAAQDANMDSGARKKSALGDGIKGPDTPETAVSAGKSEIDSLREWKAQKEKLHIAEVALHDLPPSEYVNFIHKVIRIAPTSWHVSNLILEAVRWLKRLSIGGGDDWRGIPRNNEDIIGRVHYQLARIAREFNVSLTRKNTPDWLLEAKKHPEFQLAWRGMKQTKRAHKKQIDSEERVIEIPAGGGMLLRAKFVKDAVQIEHIRDEVIVRTETQKRLSSNFILQAWVCSTLTEFDKNCDRRGSPLSYDWATRWADEDKYLDCFMIWAQSKWNEEGADSIQTGSAWGSGLLTSNSGGKKGAGPRYDFAAFQTRIKRLAKKQLRFWRDEIVPPAPKVSRK